MFTSFQCPFLITKHHVLLLVWITTNAANAQNLPEKIYFNRHVRPILSDRCFACHGPDSNKGREAGLRLNTPEGATMKLESGNRAIVPGDLKASAS